jgi:hypothetical protein
MDSEAIHYFQYRGYRRPPHASWSTGTLALVLPVERERTEFLYLLPVLTSSLSVPLAGAAGVYLKRTQARYRHDLPAPIC